MPSDIPAQETPFRIAGAVDVDETLRSMAGRLRSPGWESLALVGLRRRGTPLAERMALHLRELGLAAPVGQLGLKRYDDQLNVLHPAPRIEELPLPFLVEGARIVVVDDVLYTGRTLLAAANHFLSRGAVSVECAVLCARGEPEVPVMAATVGMRLDVPEGVAVEVHAPPFEGELGVWIRRVEA